MWMKNLGVAIAAVSVLAGCSSKSGGGGGGSEIPAAVVQALESCTQLRGIDFWELVDAIEEEIQDDASLPIQVDLDGDGTDDLTIDGTIDLLNGTVDWSLSGVLSGSGHVSFQVQGESLILTGNGTIVGLDGCSFDFTILGSGPLGVSDQGFDGELLFDATTPDGNMLSGAFRFTLSEDTVDVIDVLVTYVDENDQVIEEPAEDFVIEIPGLGGGPPPPEVSGDIVFPRQGRNEDDDGDFELWRVGADGSDPTRTTFNDEEDGYPAFSPDGARIAFVRGPSSMGAAVILEGELFLVNADGTDEHQVTTFGDGTLVEAPAWSSDGELIVFAVPFGSQRGIFTLDMTDPDAVPELLVDGNGQPGFHSPSFSSDGAYVAYGDDGGNITVIDTAAGFPVAIFDGSEPLFSPAGGDLRVLYVGQTGLFPSFVPAIQAFDPFGLDPEETLVEFDGVEEFPEHAAWSPDATRIVYTLQIQQGASVQWEIRNRDLATGGTQTVFGPERQVLRPSWRPSPETVVAAAGHLWSLDADGGSLRRLTREPGSYAAAVLSPDAGRVAYVARPEGSPSDELFVMDAGGSGVHQMTRLGLGARVMAPAWASDGERVTFTVDFGSGPEPWTLDVERPGSEERLATE